MPGRLDMKRPAYLLDLASMAYEECLALQRTSVTARHDGRLDRDLIIMVEHTPVFTLGRRGGRENLLVSEEHLDQLGIPIVPVERGGDITYHGPGQLVVYIIIALKAAQLAVVEIVDRLEQAMIRTAAHWQVIARGDATHRGAWVQQRKLGSVGITVRRGISFHGLAFNVNNDLTPFAWINPCGIEGCNMTSLAEETQEPLEMDQVRRRMADQLNDLLQVELTGIDLERFKAQF